MLSVSDFDVIALQGVVLSEPLTQCQYGKGRQGMLTVRTPPIKYTGQSLAIQVELRCIQRQPHLLD